LGADYLAEHVGARGLAAGDLLAVFPEVLAAFIQGNYPETEEGICFQRVIS
jgi:hypothetical protein